MEHGLAGVNIHTGRTEREIRMRDLDERFVTDEALGLMFISAAIACWRTRSATRAVTAISGAGNVGNPS